MLLDAGDRRCMTPTEPWIWRENDIERTGLPFSIWGRTRRQYPSLPAR